MSLGSEAWRGLSCGSDCGLRWGWGAATQGRSAPNGILRGVPAEGSLSVDNIFVFVVIFSELLVRTTPAGGTEQAPGRSGVEGKVQRR